MAFHPNLHYPLAAVEIERTRIRLVGPRDWLGQVMACFLDACHDNWDEDPEPEARGLSAFRAETEQLRHESDGRRAVLRQCHSAGPEKRHDERQALQQPVQVVPLGADGHADWAAAYEAVARNVSHGGMAVLQAQPNWAERLLIRRPAHGARDYAIVTVRHVRSLGSGMMELGCQSPGWSPVAVTRYAERRGKPRGIYTECVELFGLSGHGIGRDVSETGLSVLTRRPVSLGTCVLALPRKSGVPWHIPAKIIRCDEIVTGIYDVGVRFCRLDRQA